MALQIAGLEGIQHLLLSACFIEAGKNLKTKERHQQPSGKQRQSLCFLHLGAFPLPGRYREYSSPSNSQIS